MEETTIPQIELETPPIQIKDNSKRAKNLKLTFQILIGINVFVILSTYLEIELLKDLRDGYYIDENTIFMSDLRQFVIMSFQMIIYITSIVLFLNWFRRAYGNLHRLYGRNILRHKESMAVWSWIIPIAWFFWPVQIMNEIWKNTQLKIKQFDPSYIIKSAGWLIGLWWALFILSNFVGRYAFKAAFKEDTIEQLIESSQATLFTDILHIPEAYLVILIVTQLSQFETKLKDEVQKAGGTVVHK